jgi:hypothetical protein
MAKSKNTHMSGTQRKTRIYQVVFSVVSLIVLLSMMLSMLR